MSSFAIGNRQSANRHVTPTDTRATVAEFGGKRNLRRTMAKFWREEIVWRHFGGSKLITHHSPPPHDHDANPIADIMVVSFGNVRYPLQYHFARQWNFKATSLVSSCARSVSSLADSKNLSAHSLLISRHSHHLLLPLPLPAAVSSMRASHLSSTSVLCNTAFRPFTSAYQGTPSDGKHNHQLLTHLIPYQSTLKDGRRVEVDFFRHSPTDIEEDEWYVGMALMNLVIREGRSWPFEAEFTSVDDWRAYFLSHTAFVVRALDNGMDAARRNSSSPGEILGCFYIKPNFPGRCSHVANGGFITAPRFRGLGIGRLMGKVFLRAARDTGYKSR